MIQTTMPNSASSGRRLLNLRGGCQCKISGVDLQDLLDQAGCGSRETGKTARAIEDCGVISHAGSILLFTNDINALVGVDTFDAGRIAALHALSDVWACGGTPRWATVTLVLNPNENREQRVAIMKGMQEACNTENTDIVGGHTIYGPETMAGLSVVGVISENGMIFKQGCSIGDYLLLSKPLGVGLALRAYACGLVSPEALDEAIVAMTTANRAASQAAVAAHCHAMTDVTGFGLLGHLSEMLGPGQGAAVQLDRVPILSCVRGLPRSITGTAWIESNYEYADSKRRLISFGDSHCIAPLLDPQTNGGLLTAVPESGVGALEAAGFVRIGHIIANEVIEVR